MKKTDESQEQHKFLVNIPEQCAKCEKFEGFSVYLKENEVIYHCPETLKLLTAFQVYYQLQMVKKHLPGMIMLGALDDIMGLH